MKILLAAILLLFPLAGRGSEGELRLPAGEQREKGGAVTVALGFGSVVFPTGALAPAGPLESKASHGRLKACNRGTFSLAYELAREGRRVIVRTVSVRVTNEARFIDAATPDLRRHEEVHQSINRAQAARLEKELAAFSVETDDLKAAEDLLCRKFKEGLRTVEALHKEWDANSVFVEPASGKEAAADGGVGQGAGVVPAEPAVPPGGHEIIEGVAENAGHPAEQGRQAPGAAQRRQDP